MLKNKKVYLITIIVFCIVAILSIIAFNLFSKKEINKVELSKLLTVLNSNEATTWQNDYEYELDDEGQVVRTTEILPQGLTKAATLRKTEQGIEDTTWQNGYEYDLDEGKNTITLKKYIGDKTELVVQEYAVISGKTYTTALQKSDDENTIWNDRIKKISFEEGIILPSDCSYMFFMCSQLEELDISNFDTSNVSDMKYMFYYCKKLRELDVSKFDTSKVIDMKNMFNGCEELTELDVSRFNTSNTRDMNFMFYDCKNLQELDVSKFDTSKVTDMQGMFDLCINLTNLDVSKWDTSKVTSIHHMFAGCSSLTSLDLSSFDLKMAEGTERTGYGMFEGCDLLQTIKAPVNIPNGVVHPLNGEYEILDDEEQVVEKTEILPQELPQTVVLKRIGELINVTLKQAPTKVEYVKGEELDLAGGKLELTFKYGRKEEIDITKEMVTGYHEDFIGEQTIKVTYEGFEVSFNVTVIEDDDSFYIRFINLILEEGQIRYLSNIQPNTTLSRFKRTHVDTNGSIEIYNGETPIGENDNIGTGYILKITRGKKDITYTLVVKGDSTGDGQADFSDILKINKHRLGKASLEGAYLKAGDVTGDEKADFSDILRINKFRLGKINEL